MGAATTVPPFEGIDPDNINYVPKAYEIHKLMTSLPEGWIRRDPKDISPNQPPYLHEPSGQVSWRNPNHVAIMKLVNQEDNTTTTPKHKMVNSAEKNSKSSVKSVKKLRLMLKAGAPLGAVEQKASLEGIDMGSVLSSSDDDDENNSRGKSQVIIPEILVKKYKRMLKAGIPMDRVQQLASIETDASPEQVESIVTTYVPPVSEITKDLSHQKSFAKFVKMKNAGIPVVAILNTARLQGFNVDEVTAALEGRKNSSSPVALVVEDGPAVKVIDESAEKRSDNSNLEASIPPHFISLEGNKVAFPSARGCNLTALVRKMVQTVAKTTRFHDDSAQNEMIVDETTLFHALGALKGVQFARDEFNCTIGNHMSDELAFSKRHGFTEMARSVGMVIPESFDEAVDIEGLDDLVASIEEKNMNDLIRAKTLLADSYYDFDSLHVIYSPGSYVFAKHAGGGGIDSVCQVVWSRYTQGKTILGKPMKYFQLCVRYIVPLLDGKTTFAETVQGIEMFEGVRVLDGGGAGLGLSFSPIRGDERDEILLKQYSSRGRVYNQIVKEITSGKGYSYMEYEKGCFSQKRSGSFGAGKASVALASGGRVVLDLDAALENGHSISVGRDDMIEGLHMKMKEYKLHLKLADAKGDMVLFSQIPEEYLALHWPTLVGFSLTSKSWGDVTIDGLKEIEFDKSIFERLVLPDSRKQMIRALVKHTSCVEGGFRDLVKGKGEGTVFLMYGEPGSGKTLTAEAIAELLRKPLYSVSMGTLGTSADELERRLGEILQLSARWDSLVLLDEADSFLEARSSSSSLERNAMVSVMLRLSEYHRGILFLTSNRIDSLDPAFQTRITLALRYEPLNKEGRRKVWENLLLKSGYESSMLSFDLNELSKPTLNGREIKNSLRLAMAMAADEHSNLSQKLLLNSVSVVSEFKDSMSKDWSGKKKKPRKTFIW
eukprot:CAMPEP_0201718278 /NCGR_PEP_ID=MMETSP0593-20130828/3826_1 /ASSEMBLY_ACC=CAM_ASM_000672 /TAXON_ID=267983 /ORGANISM="Skeletonema japonicum, Strain CCMP2506" /LENGTH=942 /DNA_ID=CAMNT_0048208537 /DNA_START=9 /DNA_END=2834 /DNA_ORIENTATION=+